MLPLALAACALVAAAPPQPLLAITLYEGGLARVDAFIPTGGNLSVAVPLLGRPDPSLGVLVVDEWGEPLAYAVNETLRTLFVANINSSLVHASYYTQDLTSKAGAVCSLNFTSPYRVRVALPENATATWLGRLPRRVYTVGARIVLEYEPRALLLSEAERLVGEARRLAQNCSISEAARKLVEAVKLVGLAHAEVAKLGAMRFARELRGVGVEVNETEVREALKRGKLAEKIAERINETLRRLEERGEKIGERLRKLEKLVEKLKLPEVARERIKRALERAAERQREALERAEGALEKAAEEARKRAKP